MGSRLLGVLVVVLCVALPLGLLLLEGQSHPPAPAPAKTADPRARLAAPAMPGKNVPAIKVNTVGYPSAWPKLAILNQAPTAVTLVDEKGAVVHRVPTTKIRGLGVDPASQDPVWQVDFSDFNQSGRFTLTNGAARSDPFSVGNELYRPALIARFVLNRCGARTVIARETAETLADHDPPVLTSAIGQRVAFAAAAQSGRLVSELDDADLATREIAALASAIERLDVGRIAL